MEERAFIVVGLFVLAGCGVFVLAVLVAWIREGTQRHMRMRKDPALFQDWHHAERQRELARLSQPAAKGLSEESKRARLEAATKTGSRT